MATTDDVSSVRTPGIQVTIDSESTTQVGVDAQKSDRGRRGKRIGLGRAVRRAAPAVKLAVGDKVTATPAGRALAGQEAAHAARRC